MKNTEIIGYLILSGFIPRDKDLECIDFFHKNINSDSYEYNWGIIFTPGNNYAQVSDSSGYIPISIVIDSQEKLNKVIEIYIKETGLKSIYL